MSLCPVRATRRKTDRLTTNKSRLLLPVSLRSPVVVLRYLLLLLVPVAKRRTVPVLRLGRVVRRRRAALPCALLLLASERVTTLLRLLVVALARCWRWGRVVRCAVGRVERRRAVEEGATAERRVWLRWGERERGGVLLLVRVQRLAGVGGLHGPSRVVSRLAGVKDVHAPGEGRAKIESKIGRAHV